MQYTYIYIYIYTRAAFGAGLLGLRGLLWYSVQWGAVGGGCSGWG